MPAKTSEPCIAPGCSNRHYAKGYCKLHRRRVLKFGQPDLPTKAPRPVCAVPSCNRIACARDYCNTHNERLRTTGSVSPYRPIKKLRSDEPCDLDGCERRHYCLGFCRMHYLARVSKPRRRALEAAAPGQVTAEQLQARIDYYGGLCWMCGAPWTCIDHVKPLARGGCNWPANLRPACRSCNARKHHHWPYPTVSILRKAA